MSQLFGPLLILIGVVVTGWLIAQGKRNKTAIVFFCGITVFAGIAIVMSERISEVTIGNIGTIKAAAQQAQFDVKEIAAMKEQIKTQSATIEHLAKVAAESKQFIDEKLKQADRSLSELQEHLRPRSLTEEQASRFVEALKKGPKGTVVITCIHSNTDREACSFGNRIALLLKTAGWNVGEVSNTEFGMPPQGICIAVNSEPNLPARTLQEAFNGIGFPTRYFPFTGSEVDIDGEMVMLGPQDIVHLIIGYKS